MKSYAMFASLFILVPVALAAAVVAAVKFSLLIWAVISGEAVWWQYVLLTVLVITASALGIWASIEDEGGDDE